MELQITLNLDNAAFDNEEERDLELNQIFADIRHNLGWAINGDCFDSNGNNVGKWSINK